VSPDLIDLGEELFVILNVSQLTFRISIFLQSPVRRRGQDEVNASGDELTHGPSVRKVKDMSCRNSVNRFSDQPYKLFVFRDARDIRLRVVERIDFRGHKLSEVHSALKMLIACGLVALQLDS
jgi:hypothetical protein